MNPVETPNRATLYAMRRLHVRNAAAIGEQHLEDTKSDVSPNNIQKMGAHKTVFLFMSRSVFLFRR
jgi:hypothetical protein